MSSGGFLYFNSPDLLPGGEKEIAGLMDSCLRRNDSSYPFTCYLSP